MEPSFVREVPPKMGRGRLREMWETSSRMARSAPGQWVFVGRTWASDADKVRKGTFRLFRPAGSFVAATRNLYESRVDLYICYLGEPDD